MNLVPLDHQSPSGLKIFSQLDCLVLFMEIDDLVYDVVALLGLALGNEHVTNLPLLPNVTITPEGGNHVRVLDELIGSREIVRMGILEGLAK